MPAIKRRSWQYDPRSQTKQLDLQLVVTDKAVRCGGSGGKRLCAQACKTDRGQPAPLEEVHQQHVVESRASIESRVVQCVVKDSLRGPRAGEIESETACWHGAFGERAPDPQGANRPRFGNLVLHRDGR